MLPTPVETGLFAVLFVALCAAGVWRPRAFLWMAGFLMPLMTPRLLLFIGIDWHKVIGPVALLLAFVARRRGTQVPQLRALSTWLWYGMLVSGVWMAAEYSVLHRYRLAEAMGLGDAQSFYKMPVQLGTLVTVAMCAWAIPRFAETADDVRSAVNGLVTGTLVSLAFGAVLLAATGRGMLSPDERQGIIELDGADVGRIGGLSGEPKMLGAVLVVVLLYALTRLTFASERARSAVVVTAVLALGLFATYSTSAWVASGIGVAVLGFASLRHIRASRLQRLGIVFVLAGIVAATSPTFWNAVDQRLTTRLVGRKSELARQKDSFLWDALDRKPVHGIWGFGLGGTDLEVIPYVPAAERAYARTPTAAVTGMRFFGDLGALGLISFLAVILYWSRHLAQRGDPEGAVFMVAGAAGTLMCSINALPCFFFLAGGYLTNAALHSPTVVRAASSAGRARAPIRVPVASWRRSA